MTNQTFAEKMEQAKADRKRNIKLNIKSTPASKVHTRCQKSQYVQPKDTFNRSLEATWTLFFGDGEQPTDDVSLESAIAANNMRKSHTEYYSDVDQETGEEIKEPVTVWSDTGEPVNSTPEPHHMISIDEAEALINATGMQLVKRGKNYAIVNEYNTPIVTAFTKFGRFGSNAREDQQFDGTVLHPIVVRYNS
ncbi:MAG TPA: hypothetical protein ENI05_09355 [Porticoccus sp.]|nr:hypothetical protein [Porticoccus sp.]